MTPNSLFKLGAAVIASILALILIIGSSFSVPEGYVGVKTRFKASTSENYGSGLHFKLPIVEDVRFINVQQQTFQAQKLDAVTMPPDLQRVTTDIAVNFAVDVNKVNWVYANYRDTDSLVQRTLAPALEESVKSITARYTAEQLISKRQEVRDSLVATLRTKLRPFGIEVADISMTQFQFSQSFSAAIEAKVVAEQRSQTAKNDLERIKIEGEQRVAQAKAEADAIRVQAEAITKQGGKEYVELKAIEKWDGVLPTTIAGGVTPFVNVNK